MYVCMYVCMHDGGKDNTSNIISLPTLYIHNILLTLKHSDLVTLPLSKVYLSIYLSIYLYIYIYLSIYIYIYNYTFYNSFIFHDFIGSFHEPYFHRKHILYESYRVNRAQHFVESCK